MFPSPSSVTNAHSSFTTLLDAPKSGLRLKADVFETDKKKYGGFRVRCLKTPKKTPGNIASPHTDLVRPAALGTFVLDTLFQEGEKLNAMYMDTYREVSKSLSKIKDVDLCQPYVEAEKRAARAKDGHIPHLHDELQMIVKHVDKIHEGWKKLHANTAMVKESNNHSRKKSTKCGAINSLARKFAERLPDLVFISNYDADLIKASLAYTNSFDSCNPGHFAFSMASGSLCAIKARAKEPVTMTLTFGNCMSIAPSIVRVLAAVAERRYVK